MIKNLFYFLLFSIPMYGEATEFFSGNVLYGYAASYERMENPSLAMDGDPMGSGMYMGYIAGIIGAASGIGLFCEPSNITLGQSADIVYKYLRNHPENRNLQASLLVIKALNEDYPCRKN